MTSCPYYVQEMISSSGHLITSSSGCGIFFSVFSSFISGSSAITFLVVTERNQSSEIPSRSHCSVPVIRKRPQSLPASWRRTKFRLRSGRRLRPWSWTTVDMRISCSDQTREPSVLLQQIAHLELIKLHEACSL